jgi:hypothetical protein
MVKTLGDFIINALTVCAALFVFALVWMYADQLTTLAIVCFLLFCLGAVAGVIHQRHLDRGG